MVVDADGVALAAIQELRFVENRLPTETREPHATDDHRGNAAGRHQAAIHSHAVSRATCGYPAHAPRKYCHRQDRAHSKRNQIRNRLRSGRQREHWQNPQKM
jgi:hypothetical protein